MNAIPGNAMWRRGRLALALALSTLFHVPARAQMSGGQSNAAKPATDAGAAPSQGVELDRVVAVVNGDLILESDVDEERRLEAFQPFHDSRSGFQRDKAIERLIDRRLIFQQAKLLPEDEISDKAVNEQLAVLRKDIPACKEYHCETDAGWQKFVADQGFTLAELTHIWRERMGVLRFIEVRFRMGIHISEDDIQTYYEKTLVPQYERQEATPPKLETISDRIQEILLQQQVGVLLDDWLKSLRAQGTVRMMTQGEVEP